jgi:DNA-binding winged helix-turn-helix (wHTH) protein
LTDHPVKLFNDFRLDTRNHSLWRVDERVPLAPKPFDVLRFLVENAGCLISHDTLLDAIWPDTYVNPEILRKYILEVRKALGDLPKAPTFIETHAKRGYRFIAPVVDLCRPCSDRPTAVDQLKPHMTDTDLDRRKIVLITAESTAGPNGTMRKATGDVLNTELKRLITEITETIGAISRRQTFVLMITDDPNPIPLTPDLITIAEQ